MSDLQSRIDYALYMGGEHISKGTREPATAPFDPATCKAGCRDYRVHGIPQPYHEARCSGYINPFEECAEPRKPEPVAPETIAEATAVTHECVGCPYGKWWLPAWQVEGHRAAGHDVRPTDQKGA